MTNDESKTAEREAFEKWAVPRITMAPVRREDGYAHIALNAAWGAWQASADATLERVLEYIPTVTGPTGGWLVSPKKVEDAVLALKSTDSRGDR